MATMISDSKWSHRPCRHHRIHKSLEARYWARWVMETSLTVIKTMSVSLVLSWCRWKEEKKERSYLVASLSWDIWSSPIWCTIFLLLILRSCPPSSLQTSSIRLHRKATQLMMSQFLALYKSWAGRKMKIPFKPWCLLSSPKSSRSRRIKRELK